MTRQHEMNMPPKPRFDPTFNWGHILIFIGMLTGAIAHGFIVYTKVLEIKQLAVTNEQRISKMELTLQTISETQKNIAVQQVEIRELRRQIERMESIERMKSIERMNTP